MEEMLGLAERCSERRQMQCQMRRQIRWSSLVVAVRRSALSRSWLTKTPHRAVLAGHRIAR